MLILLVAQAAVAQTPIDAERAFARAAQTRQWAAFRTYSTPDAVMFVPQPVKAHAWLATAKEPGRKLMWQPSDSYVSCDGRLAVNTGTWTLPGSKDRGYFTTIWVRQPNGGWKWIYDGGDSLATQAAAPAKPKVRKAACKPRAEDALGDREAGVAQQDDGRSADNTLQWRWTYTAERARALDVYLWNGTEMERVIEDRVDPPAPVTAK